MHEFNQFFNAGLGHGIVDTGTHTANRTVPLEVQQPGLTGTSIGNNAITSLEMFSVMANTQALTGHLIGLWVSLWLLQRLARR